MEQAIFLKWLNISVINGNMRWRVDKKRADRLIHLSAAYCIISRMS